MNAFAAYASQAIPPSVQRRQAKREEAEAKAPSALEQKMEEKQRLTKLYKAWQREVRTATLALEPRLRAFHRYLRTVKPEQGDELLEQIRISPWLTKADQSVRIFALRLIDRHANRLARQIGREPLDDPMPPETSVYFEARALLHAGGRT